MNVLLNGLRAIVWFMLCAGMAVGMLTFALIYAGFSFIFKKLAWKDLSVPSFKIAK